MKNNTFVKIWNIIYPIFLYYVVSNVVIALAVTALSLTEERYREVYTLLQLIAMIIALPVLYRFWRQDKLLCTVFHQRTENGWKESDKRTRIGNAVLTLVCGALAGIVLNNLIGATGLTELSTAYQEVTNRFFAPDVWVELVSFGIVAPLAEELLYRGIVYGRLSDWMSIPVAALVSALVFSGLHFNIVQFAYAFPMGLLLVFFLERCHSLIYAILGHVGANLLTVLRVETGILNWMEQSQVIFWGSTIAFAVLCLLFIWLLNGKKINMRAAK